MPIENSTLMVAASETNSATVCLPAAWALLTISRTCFWISAFLPSSVMKPRSILRMAGSKWLSIWNEFRPVPNCSSATRQPRAATAVWKACTALRWVNTLDSGICSTSRSPGTACAASCSAMNSDSPPSTSDAGVTFTNRLVCLPAFCRSLMTATARRITQRSMSSSRPCSSAMAR